MMNLVMFGYFVSTSYFSEMTDINLKEMMFKKKMEEIEQDIPPFGHIDDGVDNYERDQEAKYWQEKFGQGTVSDWE